MDSAIRVGYFQTGQHRISQSSSYPSASKSSPPTQKRATRPRHDLAVPLGMIEVDVPTGFPFPTPADLPIGIRALRSLPNMENRRYASRELKMGGFLSVITSYTATARITIATLRNGRVARAESVSNEHATVATP